MEVGPNGVTVAGVVDPNDILVVAPDGSPHSPRQEEELELPKQSCLCGLIEDEVCEPEHPSTYARFDSLQPPLSVTTVGR